jgi:hypothetical protein
MKRLFSILLLVSLLTAILVPGCSKKEEAPAVPLSHFDGTWIDGEGDVLLIDSQRGCYTFRKANGRTGIAEYSAIEGRIFLYFNWFLYEVVETEPGEFRLVQNGRSADEDAESLDGVVFCRDDSVSVKDFSLYDADGTWVNESGVVLTIDASEQEYRYSSDDGTGTGTVNDDGVGMGWYLYADGNAYIILSEDGTLTFQTNDPLLSGTFTRQD